MGVKHFPPSGDPVFIDKDLVGLGPGTTWPFFNSIYYVHRVGLGMDLSIRESRGL